jgi:hypothetical protein
MRASSVVRRQWMGGTASVVVLQPRGDFPAHGAEVREAAGQTLAVKQQSGTELTTTDKGWQATTYVTPEEYDKMTPAERERLNASVGVSATVATWGNSKPQSKDVSTKDLDQAKKDAKE